ncbi:MAG: hypothetical protein HETSPECPRED_001267 [Heterodermia speciosa]|uniref:CFEM domain-containing protein n=1 Tax=Heterodermia speciosa TaxID=116794 RepID=A0A8H3EZ88_9LECA|nr:MAG: hypothetical protein HETSPECPRED_001267 [Heterodermia speciosa]
MPLILSTVFILLLKISCGRAQGISDLPECATQAAFSSLTSTGCQISDIGCICKDQSFISSLLPVVEKACSPADLQKTVDFAEAFCKSAGISLTVPAVAQTTSSATMSTQGAGSVISATALQNVTLASSKTIVQQTLFQPTPRGSATVAPLKGSGSKSHGQILKLSMLLSFVGVISGF